MAVGKRRAASTILGVVLVCLLVGLVEGLFPHSFSAAPSPPAIWLYYDNATGNFGSGTPFTSRKSMQITAGSPSVQTGTATYSGTGLSHDTRLVESVPTTNYGTQTTMYIRSLATGNMRQRCIMDIDFSRSGFTAREIPTKGIPLYGG